MTLDLDAIETRAEHYARLCHQTGNSHAPDVVKAAHACADDVPPLLDELRAWTSGKRRWVRGVVTFGDGKYTLTEATDPLRDRVNQVLDNWRHVREHIGDPQHPISALFDQVASAARATEPAPATPPELYAVLVPTSASTHVDICVDPSAARDLAAERAAEEHPGYRAYRLVPLSTTPPAGTEPASATAVDPPAGMQP